MSCVKVVVVIGGEGRQSLCPCVKVVVVIGGEGRQSLCEGGGCDWRRR